MKTIAYNKRAKYDYNILDTFEAGLILSGQEVKSTKAGNISLKGAYVTIKTSGKNSEAFLVNTHISRYKKAGPLPEYDPERPRKLLLHRKEIDRLIGKLKEKGLTLVPIKVYTKHNKIKLEFGIGKGRKKIDKRELIKKRDIEKQIRKEIKF